MTQAPRAPRAHTAGIAIALAHIGLLIGASGVPVMATGPQIIVEPGEVLTANEQEITVTGSGFDPEANGGAGVYLVFGALTEAPTYYTDAELYIAARWIHPGAADVVGQAPMADDGSFTTTLTIEPVFVDGHGTEVDCVADDCVLITMAAHGVDDRTQDTFTPITFVASEAPTTTPSPTVSPVPSAADEATEAGADWAGPVVSASLGLAAITAAAVVLLRRRRPAGR